MKALVVDDDHLIRSNIAEVLSNETTGDRDGYHVLRRFTEEQSSHFIKRFVAFIVGTSPAAGAAARLALRIDPAATVFVPR